MPLYRDEGIVLRTQKLAEADRIVTLLTRGLGKVRVVGKGDDNGTPIAATIPEDYRQRELAYRFGVNVVMYPLTGNYKADQVHVPALLERLGQ